MEPFQLFGGQHLIALGLVATFSLVAFKMGRGVHSDRWNLIVATIFTLFGVSLWWVKLKNGFQWDLDLPLALCDVAFLMCLYCFFDPKPRILTCVTYWGLGGTLQALITPDVLRAFPSVEFIVFFIGHSVIIWAVFFLLGRAPHQRLAGSSGLRTSFFALLLYTVIVGSLDFLFGWNYGYLKEKPMGASILDFFGPWPLYVLGGLLTAFFIFSVLAIALKGLPPKKSQN